MACTLLGKIIVSSLQRAGNRISLSTGKKQFGLLQLCPPQTCKFHQCPLALSLFPVTLGNAKAKGSINMCLGLFFLIASVVYIYTLPCV